MASLLPNNFPQPSSTSFVTTDFSDVATGTSYVQFFLYDSDGDYHLTQQELYAHNGWVQGDEATATDTDFDITFDRTFKIEGVVTAYIAGAFRNLAAGEETPTQTIIVTLQHYDGTTETDLGTDTSAHSKVLASGIDETFMYAFNFTSSLSKFKKGDTLRLRVQSTLTNSTDGAHQIGIDPKGRTDAIPPNNGITWAPTSQSLIAIPVKIQL